MWICVGLDAAVLDAALGAELGDREPCAKDGWVVTSGRNRGLIGAPAARLRTGTRWRPLKAALPRDAAGRLHR